METVSDNLRRARPLLGTIVEIAAPAGHRAEGAIDAAFAAIATVHRLMSFHDRASDVSRLNRDAWTVATEVHPWTFEVLRTATELTRRSAGMFDIAVAPLLQQIGLLPNGVAAESGSFTPSTGEAIELLPRCRVRFRRQNLRIDLGGIAKGFAVDCAIDILRQAGMPSGLVNAGGDLAAIGPPQSVHIRDPRDPRRSVCRLDLADGALASSGGRFDPFRTAAPGDTAVIDPAARAPARAIIGATVLAPSCMVADAMTKPVMIAPERAAPLLAHHGAHALVMAADGAIQVTSNWPDRVSLAA
jgi:thiamine biosynthesis lipoprotein